MAHICDGTYYTEIIKLGPIFDGGMKFVVYTLKGMEN